ncbi:MAG: Coenzyme F420 hydrogenase/dehydrogenase, beta subunit C-terminal domain [Rikenellaceae bacterium]
MRHIDALKYRDRCSGCTACLFLCPEKAISLVEDCEGFLYPKVEESRCVDCGLCLRVCPSAKVDYRCSATQLDTPIAYAAKHKEDGVRSKSTSGGVFTSLSDYILFRGGVVCGAMFNAKTQRVEHTLATSVEERDMMRGSKYVQSYLGDIFLKIRALLEGGVEVLFVGTPCQTAGLFALLKEDYSNLYVVDILCHSTPNPLIFKDMIKSHTHEATDIIFRDKSLGWRSSYGVKVVDVNNIYPDSNFLKLYWKGLISRPSCHRCNFTNLRRPSDITLGDYWGINKVCGSFEDQLGVSTVLINSKRGEELFKAVKNDMDTLQTTLNDTMQDCMQRRVRSSYRRASFWRDYRIKGYSYVAAKYSRDTLFEVVKLSIKKKLY